MTNIITAKEVRRLISSWVKDVIKADTTGWDEDKPSDVIRRVSAHIKADALLGQTGSSYEITKYSAKMIMLLTAVFKEKGFNVTDTSFNVTGTKYNGKRFLNFSW